jgi:hypothetical protein
VLITPKLHIIFTRVRPMQTISPPPFPQTPVYAPITSSAAALSNECYTQQESTANHFQPSHSFNALLFQPSLEREATPIAMETNNNIVSTPDFNLALSTVNQASNSSPIDTELAPIANILNTTARFIMPSIVSFTPVSHHKDLVLKQS